MLLRILVIPFIFALINTDGVESKKRQKRTYVALIPKTIRPGLTTSVNINVLRRVQQKLTLTARLIDDNKEITITSKSQKIRTPGNAQLNLKIPKTLKDSKFTIEIEGKRKKNKIVFKNSTKVTYSSKSTASFIQTDKGIYKPGQKVYIRAFSVYPDLNVVCERKDIIITDSKSNRVKQWLRQTPKSCVFEGRFQLTEYTNLGVWTIEYREMGQVKRVQFTVDEYVLPKFEVTVTLPTYTLSFLRFFTGKITARYTFGKPVQGRVSLQIMTTRRNKIEKQFDIDGEATFRILMSEVTSEWGGYVTVNATVTEGVTGNERYDYDSVRIYKYREKLRFSESLPKVFKPNLAYTAILRVTQQDNTPLENALGMVSINISYRVPVLKELTRSPPVTEKRIMPPPRPFPLTETKYLPPRRYDIPSDGIIQFQFKIPKAATSASVNAQYKFAGTGLYLQRAQSPSNNYILLELKTEKPQAGKMTFFRITSTSKPQKNLMYQVFSKGNLITQGQPVKPRRIRKTINFAVRLPATAAPRAQVLVYYVRKNGEVVADSVSFTLNGAFRNKVRVNFSESNVKPGEKVALELKASQYSTVYVLAVDKSILLLKSGNDITQMEVIKALQGFDINVFDPWRWWWWFPIPTNGIDAYSVFENAGLKVLTDASIYRYQQNQNIPFLRQDVMAFASMESKSAGAPLAVPSRVRKFFPETWIFDKKTSNKNGETFLLRSAPDTITTFVASAFAVNRKAGFGVAPTNANLTVFQNFFIRLNLPYSTIRGEILILQVDVFNYVGSDQTATVTLQKGQFSFSDDDGKSFDPTNETSGWSKTLLVKDGDVRSVYFPIIPDVIGKIKLKVDARSTEEADAVERDLLVEAEGIPKRYSIATFIDLRQGGNFKTKVDITFPQNVVPDSEYIQVTAIGDILGSTNNGIENLLHMSYGCGEQNLIRFVPNVFVTDYLQTTGRLTAALKQKAIAYLEQGYQRELIYKHNNGSYSAFGESDKSGSAWLTAFVLKSFAQAKGKIYIDPNVMTQAIKWLLKQQTSGEFREPGVVFHKEMQGGSVSSKKSLTAFVLVALQEAKDKGFVSTEIKRQVDEAISDALKYITFGFPASVKSMYELAITTYALRITSHHLAETALNEMEKLATNKDGMKYWAIPVDQLDSIQPYKSWTPPKTRNRALDIEVTSYVLLVYAIKKDITNGIPVTKWLVTQRNLYGGFVSTQDTVLAIQALSSMAILVYTSDFSIKTKVENIEPGGALFQHTFRISNKNSLVLQTVEPPKSVRKLNITANGKGISLVEVAVYYNVRKELRQPAFHLDYTLTKETINGFRVDVCFWWLRNGTSTMALLEIGIPTGMEADLSTLDTSKSLYYKSSDLGYRKVDVYFDKVVKQKSCVGVEVRRTSLIARHKPVPIIITDYYEPSNIETIEYQSTLLANATIIEVCGEKCINVKK